MDRVVESALRSHQQSIRPDANRGRLLGWRGSGRRIGRVALRIGLGHRRIDQGPRAVCGVFGHKPSCGLVPNTGMYPPTPGTAGRLLGVGPLARRAEDLTAVLRIIAGPDGVDPVARSIALGDPGGGIDRRDAGGDR
jgi:hypothetical protein